MTLSESIQEIEPKVDRLVMEQAKSPVEIYLIEKQDIALQQNELIAKRLDEVHSQTTKTNGRVNNLEVVTEAHDVWVTDWEGRTKRWRRLIIWTLGVLSPIVSAVLYAIITEIGVTNIINSIGRAIWSIWTKTLIVGLLSITLVSCSALDGYNRVYSVRLQDESGNMADVSLRLEPRRTTK